MKTLKYLLISSILPLLANMILSLVLGHSTGYYNRHIKAAFSAVLSSLLAIVLIVLVNTMDLFRYRKKMLRAVAITVLIISVLGIYFLFGLGFYLGGSACILWFFISIIMLYAVNTQQILYKQPIVQNARKRSSIISAQTNPLQSLLNQNRQQNNKKGNKFSKQKCYYCCHICCSVTTILLMTVFIFINLVYYLNLYQYPAFGQLFTIQNKQYHQNYYVHAYCIGQPHPTRPTLILEHGGGSNSIAFVELGHQLAAKNWRMCSYDRLGYGRSSVMPHNLTMQKKAQITHKTIARLLENETNKDIVIGGWSAGVELSQVYASIYPTNVKGMVFMDGYPDYITLMAIYDNKSTVLQPNTAGIVELVRILEPLGLGFITGGNNIPNTTTSQYYRAYYQTGYFWESQYFDVANPHQPTSWLTSKAGSDPKPYPNSQIDLNWPNIGVPLLVMPANQTVSNGQYAKMYLEQAQKYLEKCGSATKRLTVMAGDHAYVLDSPQVLANEIDVFLNLI